MTVDAHVHYWDPRVLEYAWLPDALARPFLPADYEGEARIVVVEADCTGGDELGWLRSLDDPRIAGIVAHVPLEDGAEVPDGVAGVRRLLQGRPDALFEAVAPGVRGLAVPFDACVTHDQLPRLIGLARACPDTAIVLDHLGKPVIGVLEPWRSQLAELAAMEHVVCKLSGLTTEAGPGWTEEALRPYLEHALDVFGPERCLLGSDWPVASLTTSNQRWFALVDQLVDRAELGRTAQRVYGI